MTTLVQLTNPATAATWLAECEAALTAATASGDLAAVVDAAGARALARHGLRVVDAAPARRPVKAARRVSRGVGFNRSKLSP
jgi:hypothetical protein